MGVAPTLLTRGSPRSGIAYPLRCLYVVARTDFKLKYAGSLLGYLWSFARPLAYFGILWLIFGRFFKGVVTPVDHFALYLLIGIVLYTFFIDAIGATLPSLVTRADLLRKLSFPRVVVPASATLTASFTFLINLGILIIFVAASAIRPGLDWLLAVPLVVELLLFVLGLGFIAATLYVRFRDVSPVWELSAQLLIFAAPVMYPLGILPEWAQDLELMNPLVQVMQDLREIVIGVPIGETAAESLPMGRLLPVAIALATFWIGVAIFRRDTARIAERV